MNVYIKLYKYIYIYYVITYIYSIYLSYIIIYIYTRYIHTYMYVNIRDSLQSGSNLGVKVHFLKVRQQFGGSNLD